MSQNGPLRFTNAEFNVSRQALCLRLVHSDFLMQSSVYRGRPYAAKRSIAISACRAQCIEAILMDQNGPLRLLNTELHILRHASCFKMVK